MYVYRERYEPSCHISQPVWIHGSRSTHVTWVRKVRVQKFQLWRVGMNDMNDMHVMPIWAGQGVPAFTPANYAGWSSLCVTRWNKSYWLVLAGPPGAMSCGSQNAICSYLFSNQTTRTLFETFTSQRLVCQLVFASFPTWPKEFVPPTTGWWPMAHSSNTWVRGYESRYINYHKFTRSQESGVETDRNSRSFRDSMGQKLRPGPIYRSMCATLVSGHEGWHPVAQCLAAVASTTSCNACELQCILADANAPRSPK